METELDHYQRLRDLFARRDFEALLHYPLGRKFPLNQALFSWAAFLEQKKLPPPSLEISQQPLAVLCQQALLWAALAQETGEPRFQQAANVLAGAIAPAVNQGFVSLWTAESEYSKLETECSIELFQQALGHPEKRKMPEGFFLELQQMHLQLTPEEPVSRPYTMYEQDGDAMLYVLEGARTALGAARVRGVRFLTFGLQKDLRSFGVDIGENGYVRVSALPEVWVQVERNAFAFSLQAVGLKPEQPLSLAFYVDAKHCFIQEKQFKPRSLNKFQGRAEKIQFDDVHLAVDQPLLTELVPLAGDHSFWGASFLLTVRLPLSGKINLQIAK